MNSKPLFKNNIFLKFSNLANLFSKTNRLRSFLYVIFGGVVLIGIYFIGSPFYPELEYQFNKAFFPEKFTSQYYFEGKNIANYEPQEEGNNSSSDSQNTIPATEENKSESQAQEENVKTKTYYKDIVIPSIALDVKIVEGTSENNLNLGSWLKPIGKKPGQYGNTILTGHRYQYFNGVRPFYNLDKVKKGQELYVIWEGKKIDYVIEDKFLVKPTDVWVQDQREGKYLTIYTCDGVDAERRLVVLAKQKEA